MRVIVYLSAVILSAALVSGQVTNRLRGPLEAADRFILKGNVRPVIASAQDNGPVPVSLAMPRMSIRFQMTAAQEADLTQLLTDQQTPGSALYHRWLTRAIRRPLRP